MDPTEDLSARVLIQRILYTEPPRTPVTRSASQAPSGSGLRRSSRFSRKDAEPQTPQNILRRSLKHKIHESITRKSLPATKRRTASVVLRKQAPSTSMLFIDGETPRHLLRNILQTEPVKSPVIHETAAPAELPPPSDDYTVTRTRSSIELSGLDLPDVTMGNVVSTAKGLSRKRPRRSLNVTAFEKRLKDGNDAEEELENSVGDHSSLSLSSSTSLSLKTPFVDVHTEKRGLKRRVSNRRKITEEEFSAALSKQQMGDVKRHGRNIGEDTNIEGITLGLSKLSEPDITADIVNCDTALYDQHDAMTSNFSIIATQDKPTVMASQLQRDVQEIPEGEEEPSGILLDPEKDEGVTDSREKEDVAQTEPQDTEGVGQPDDVPDFALSSQSEEKENAAGYQTFDLDDRVESEVEEGQTEEEAVADSQSEDVEGGSQSEQEEGGDSPQAEDDGMDKSPNEEEAGVESQRFGPEDGAESEEEEAQTEEEAAAESQSEDIRTGSQSEEEEGGDGPQAEDDGMDQSPNEEEAGIESQSEDIGTGSQSEEEEAAGSSQTGDDCMEQSQTEEEDGLPETEVAEDAVAASQSEEDEVVAGSQTEDEGGSESQAEEAGVNKSQCDVVEESQAEEDGADCWTDKDCDEDEGDQEEAWGSELLNRDVGHISHRAYRSESGLVLPVIKAKEDPTDATAAGGSHTESKSNSALGLNSSLEIRSQSQTGKPDWPQPSLQDRAGDPWTENDPIGGKNASFHLPQVSHDAEVCGQQSDASPEEAPAEDAVEEEEEWDEEDNDYEEFPSKTPAFVREKMNFFTSDPQASPSVFKNVQTSSTSEALPAAKPKQMRRRRTGLSRRETVLPKTYLMGVFKHFAKTKVSADVFPALNEIMDKFFDRLAEDLETYAAHAKRKTIEVEDVKLLLRRQGYINDKVPVEVLIEKYLRMEQRKILIPIATSGNVVIPKIRE